MAKGKADLGNTALRMFLQEVGERYDLQRGLTPFKGDKKDLAVIKAFFLDRCCYCDVELSLGATAQDHLVPMNKTALGLHAWGNVVPSCSACNSKKQARDWRDFVIQRAGAHAAERHDRVVKFIEFYAYRPTLDIRGPAEALYDEVSDVGAALIASKVKRLSP